MILERDRIIVCGFSEIWMVVVGFFWFIILCCWDNIDKKISWNV